MVELSSAGALEFYSGIGGMAYALEAAGVGMHVSCSYDINDLANDVYEFNFKVAGGCR